MVVPQPREFAGVKVLATDEEIHDYYIQEDALGDGMFGQTVKVTDVNDPEKKYAMKIQLKINQLIIMNPEVEALRLLKELLILNRILPEHPNIIQVKDILIGKDKVFIVQELCEGNSMDGFFFRANNVTGREAFGQLVEAVHTCHEHGVVHCDIKADNILFKDPGYKHLKLIDFGCAVYMPEWAVKRHRDFDHTTWFAPDELVPSGDSTKLHDVQGLGRMLHGIMSGKYLPFLFSNLVVEMQTKYRPRTERFDAAALDLLTKIGPSPFGPERDDEYLTTDQIRQHPWLTGVHGIPFQPPEPVRNLDEEFALLRNDLTVLKRLLKGWMIMPMTIVADEQALGHHYEIRDRLHRGNYETRLFEVSSSIHAKSRALKFIYGRVQNRPDIVNGDYRTRLPILIYMEMLITLRILPRHDHIVNIKEIYVNPEYVAVVKELLERNTLEDYFPNANDHTGRMIFRQLAEVVRLLHRHGVVHMDLHPHHIVFTNDTLTHCKIVNFSRARYVERLAELKHENFQPEKYVTPELAQMAFHANVQVDITALGRILHAMMVKVWEPDPTRCGELWPDLLEFHHAASNLLSKIGPEPHGPPERNRTITMDQICHHRWVTLQ